MARRQSRFAVCFVFQRAHRRLLCYWQRPQIAETEKSLLGAACTTTGAAKVAFKATGENIFPCEGVRSTDIELPAPAPLFYATRAALALMGVRLAVADKPIVRWLWDGALGLGLFSPQTVCLFFLQFLDLTLDDDDDDDGQGGKLPKSKRVKPVDDGTIPVCDLGSDTEQTEAGEEAPGSVQPKGPVWFVSYYRVYILLNHTLAERSTIPKEKGPTMSLDDEN